MVTKLEPLSETDANTAIPETSLDNTVGNAPDNKKKKKNKKKKSTGPKIQTEPPTVPVSKIFPSHVYPFGEIHDYINE